VYLGHFGLEEPPFRITPNTDFFFAGANRGATLEALLYAITHDEGIVKVTGEVGSGKTMLCRVLIERLPENVETIFLASPSLSRDEILHALADDLHLSLPGARTTVLLRALQEHLITVYAGGRRVVLLVDEAHAMPAESLEEVRLLSNLESSREKLLQIVLFGQPELDERLGRPEMRQLRERITHSFKLQPLARAEIDSYIDFRLRQAGYHGASLFSPGALAVIARASAGLTRRINILADKSLLAAYAAGTNAVSTEHAQAAVRDSEFAEPDMPERRQRGLVLAALATGLAVGVGAHWLTTMQRKPAAAVAVSPTTAPAPGAENGLPTVESSRAPASSAVAPSPALRPQEKLSAGAPWQESESVRSSLTAQVGPVAAVVTASDPTLSTESAASATGAASRPAGLGPLSRDRYAATQSWLQSAPAGRQSIQLAIFTDAQAVRMENFLRQVVGVVNPSDLYVYSVKVDGRQHYRVAYGSFASASDIQAALEALPPLLKAQSPFQRSVGEMRRLNQS
jgi:type II secretory pathway predicted ATPase ExeA/septal ring-binding cell division protein DamX